MSALMVLIFFTWVAVRMLNVFGFNKSIFFENMRYLNEQCEKLIIWSFRFIVKAIRITFISVRVLIDMIKQKIADKPI